MDQLVTAVTQDSIGFMWIGTQSGLLRFDGIAFESLSALEMLPSQLIFSLYDDEEREQIWIGTESGAAFYNYREDALSVIVFPESTQPRVFDFTKRGAEVYIATSSGLYLSEGKEVRLIDGFEGNIVRTLELDAEDRLLVGTERNGLYLETESGYRPYEPFDMVSFVREILKDSRGVLWIATVNGGVSRLIPGTDRAQPLLSKDLKGNARVRALVEDQEGNIWLGSDDGLYKWSVSQQSLLYYKPKADPYGSQGSEIVYDLYLDTSGTIWIGTYSGLTRVNTDFINLERVSLEGLSVDGTVSAFAENMAGLVAIGTTRGVAMWEPKSGVVHDFVSHLEKFEHFVTSLEFSNDGSLWIGTYSDGLYRFFESQLTGPFDLEHDQFKKYGITDLHVGPDETLWIATAGSGIFALDRNRSEFRSYPDIRNPQGAFPDLKCLSIREQGDGRFWIATNDFGPFLFDPQTGTTVDYSEGLEKLSSNILVDEDVLWVGSFTGQLHRLQWKERVHEERLLSSNFNLRTIYGLEKAAGKLLIAGQGGLVFYSEQHRDGRLLDKRHNFLTDVTYGASTKLSSGTVLFGGASGFNVIRPADVSSKKYKYSPDVIVSKLQVNHVVMPVTDNQRLELDFFQNDVNVDYAITDYLFPEQLRSSYKLEGFDKDWIENGNKRSLTYTNLDPGSYVLRVKGTNSDGVWSPNELVLPIHISPPWWASWWAYTLYVTVALFAFYQLLQLSARRVSVQAEERFNQRLRHYVSALDDASECVLNATSSGRILYVNDAVREVLGKTVSEVIGHSLFDVLFESDSLKQDALRMLEVEGYYLEEVASRVNQDEKVLEVSIRKSEERADDEVVFVCVVRDVTERSRKATDLKSQVVILHEDIQRITGRLEEAVKASEAYQTEAEARIARDEGLLKSFHDRINDNFQMLSSLFSLQASKTVDVPVVRVLDEVQQRVKTVALVHEQLLQTEEMGRVAMSDYMDVLVTSLYRHLAPRHIQLDLTKDISDFFMSIDQAVPSGLIVNELVTNALVHAYSARTHGSGQLRVSSYELAGECVLLVSDDGQGLPSDFQFEKGSGVGFEIVSILTKQLGGSFKLVGGIGTTFEVRFPIVPVT